MSYSYQLICEGMCVGGRTYKCKIMNVWECVCVCGRMSNTNCCRKMGSEKHMSQGKYE